MKTVRFFLFVFFSLTLILLSGCKTTDDSNNPIDQQGSDFTFVKVGHLWTYSVTFQGTPYPDMTYEVVSALGNNIYKVKQTYTYPNQTVPSVQYPYWYCTASEYATLSDSTGLKKMMVFNSSTNLNQEYSYISNGEGGMPVGDTLYYKLLSETENVTVPAGTFVCAKISLYGTPYSNNMPITYIYSSNSAGTIKIENIYSKDELKSKNF